MRGDTAGYEDGTADRPPAYCDTVGAHRCRQVMGGAYGALAALDAAAGTVALLSYRDPNLDSTLGVYAGAGAALAALAGNLTTADLELAVIGAVGSLDAPLAAEQRGYTSLLQWLAGETAEARQVWREEMLATTAADLASIGWQLEAALAAGKIVVVGSAAAFEGAVGRGFEVTTV